jgi:hypothetical protein
VDVTLEMIASSTPTTDDEASLKTTVAFFLGVEEGALKSFTVTSSFVSRRLRRYLLAVYPWTVSFTVTTPISETESSSAEAFADYVTTAMTSASFVSAVYSSVGATVDTSSVTATAGASRISISSGSSSTNAAGIAIGVIFGLLFLIGASIAVYVHRGNKMNVSCAPAVKTFRALCEGKSDEAASNQEKNEETTTEVNSALELEGGIIELKSKPLAGKELAKQTGQAGENNMIVGQATSGAMEEGSAVQFLIGAEFSPARAAFVATLFAKQGYEVAKDFKGVTKAELSDESLNEMGLKNIDIRKFRLAVAQASQAPTPGTTL